MTRFSPQGRFLFLGEVNFKDADAFAMEQVEGRVTVRMPKEGYMRISLNYGECQKVLLYKVRHSILNKARPEWDMVTTTEQ